VWWKINLDFLMLSVAHGQPPLQGSPVIQISAKRKANPSYGRQDKAVTWQLIHPQARTAAVDSILTQSGLSPKLEQQSQLEQL
jgi:hypothetical protein